MPVHRCWQFVPKRVSALKRIVHEGSFVFTSTLRALSLPRADIYVLVSPPLLLGVAGWLVGKIKGAPFVFHVQDVQPDAAVGLGMLKASWFTKALYWLESFAYRHATHVSGITRGMLKSFRSKGVPEAKLIYFPNAIALNNAAPPPTRGEFRSCHEFAPEEFLAIYAGNLGVKQGLEVLLETAPLLLDPRIRIVICGDGAQREALAERVRELKLPNISMLPLQAGPGLSRLAHRCGRLLHHAASGGRKLLFPEQVSWPARGIETRGHGRRPGVRAGAFVSGRKVRRKCPARSCAATG